MINLMTSCTLQIYKSRYSAVFLILASCRTDPDVSESLPLNRCVSIHPLSSTNLCLSTLHPDWFVATFVLMGIQGRGFATAATESTSCVGFARCTP